MSSPVDGSNDAAGASLNGAADALTPRVSNAPARDQSLVEMKSLPPPLTLFIMKTLPQVLADRNTFLATPNSKNKKKPGKLYLSDLCGKYSIAKTGKFLVLNTPFVLR